MLGGDLRCALEFLHRNFEILILLLPVHLERRGHIKEDVVRFWLAELACALEYLHRQRIIHRCATTCQYSPTLLIPLFVVT